MSCHVGLPQMINLMYGSFSLLLSCSGTMREYSGCACCWKQRCWPIAWKQDIFFLWDLVLKEDTYSAFVASWHGVNCSCREIGANLKCRGRFLYVMPAGSANLCKELLDPRRVPSESSHLLLLYHWAWKLNLLSTWWQIWLFCSNFIVHFAFLYLFLAFSSKLFFACF